MKERDFTMEDKGTVGRILRLICFIADNPEITAKQAATRLGWPISTTHRLLRTLASVDFAVQRETGVFAPGLELLRIAGRLVAELPYEQVAQPLLKDLTNRFHETSLFSILVRKQLSRYIAFSVAPPDPMRYVMEHNRRMSLVWGASGRVLLAYLTAAEVETAIATVSGLNVNGELVDVDEVRRSLKDVRARGYAVTDSHLTPNAIGIAAPVFDAHGGPMGSIAFLVPSFRYDGTILPEMTDALKQAAQTISWQLGQRQAADQ
ncbi:MAG: IclR family transcriptional regulator [Notoacmeibacter sp.]|nr:IclR family transcriptional regulator [Notoacmeibacter sp.]